MQRLLPAVAVTVVVVFACVLWGYLMEAITPLEVLPPYLVLCPFWTPVRGLYLAAALLVIFELSARTFDSGDKTSTFFLAAILCVVAGLSSTAVDMIVVLPLFSIVAIVWYSAVAAKEAKVAFAHSLTIHAALSLLIFEVAFAWVALVVMVLLVSVAVLLAARQHFTGRDTSHAR